jgi:DNA-binding CsgD family transcriptional regulator
VAARLLLCPQVIGRDEEIAVLTGAIDGLAQGRGGAVLLVGEAGIGKSRLAREFRAIAEARGLKAFVGRAVQSDNPVPFRPLREALNAAFRLAPLPTAPELAPFKPALGRLLPEWAQSNPSADSLVLLAEGILRLLRVLSVGRGCVLVLEDLHWADPETLAILEYLADNLSQEPVLCLTTWRSQEREDADRLIESIGARRAGRILELNPLHDQDIDRMVRACLGELPIPEVVYGLIRNRAEGIPFLVEELLAGMAHAGVLVLAGGGWSVGLPLPAPVPDSFAATVHRRFRSLEQPAQHALAAAAVLGRSFDWNLIPLMTGLDEQQVLGAIRSGVDAQLLFAGPLVGPEEFRFRHALTRDAVLAEVLRPEQIKLAGRALEALEGARPGLEGDACELAAELAQRAQLNHRAAELLLESGRRALARGALATAEATLEMGLAIAQDHRVAADTAEALTRTLVTAGKTDRVFEVGPTLLEGLSTIAAPPARRAEAHLQLVRSAITAGKWTIARDHLHLADTLGQEAGDSVLGGEIDVLAAELAFREGRLDEAVAQAHSALQVAGREDQAELACEALDMLGRCDRLRNLRRADASFQRCLKVAEENDLPLWRIKAMQELGTLDLWTTMRLDRQLEARDLAFQAGALATVALTDRYLAACFLNRFTPEAGLKTARRCVEDSRRFRLALLPMALAVQAFAYAELGRESEMEAAIQEALGLAPDDPDLAAVVWGSARATLALVRDDLPLALDCLNRAMRFIRQAPTSDSYPFRGMWALLRTLAGEGGDAARAEMEASGAALQSRNRVYLQYAKAVALGRAGKREEAEAAFEIAESLVEGLEGWTWFHHHAHRLVAAAAVDDRWGDPVKWLREALVFFESAKHAPLASACRVLLRRAGAVVPRRGRGDAAVSNELRALGVTSREMDVLLLLEENLTNHEIAARLHLSHRTIERHVSSLLNRTGLPDRAELRALAARLRVSTPAG